MLSHFDGSHGACLVDEHLDGIFDKSRSVFQFAETVTSSHDSKDVHSDDIELVKASEGICVEKY